MLIQHKALQMMMLPQLLEVFSWTNPLGVMTTLQGYHTQALVSKSRVCENTDDEPLLRC